ncbi:MAG: penicillin-binding protein activator [Xanthomonadales bacterium]|nr:penicillin-binding protein activator [Xanthomonadales bacterium]
MTLRFYSLFLSASLLTLLTACGTTGSVPVDQSTDGQQHPSALETNESSDSQDQVRKNLYERGLAETIELSRQMDNYQPDAALKILRSLESIPSGQLTVMIDSQIYDPEFTEWLELAVQSRKVLVGQSSLSIAAQKWEDYHYGHVITQANFSELITRYSKLFPVPARVAVLLPDEGGLSSAAKAIRDGILSAYLEQPGNAVLKFYSSGNSNESAIAAYLQAREDGATQIVGPLRNNSAGALASLNDPSVPILLLNEPTEYEPVDPVQKTVVNSLSLSQAEEVMAVAESALSQGQRKGLVMVPDSSWGRRIESTFTTRFEQGEGQVSAATRFNSASEDYSDMLTRLLKIDESKQRKTDLQSWLGISLNFEPSRRDDFDFIFMAASPKQGRELKPLLRFHDTGDIPVYAMGRIFSGKNAPASDQDLNGIVFPITNWQLHAADTGIPALESIRSGSYGHLYALGQDAWRVLPWLPLLQKDSDLWFHGEIGALRMQANGHLQRQPAWAQFSAGQPVSYEWPVTR